jgi:hypothetical protein
MSISVSATSPPTCGWVTRMTKLMVWATLVGALVGLVFFGAGCWTVHRELSSLIFDAGYEPMPGVEFSTGYTSDSAFSTSLSIDAARPSEWWTWSALVWWAYPLIGAISAAVLDAPCAIAGVRLVRQRR